MNRHQSHVPRYMLWDSRLGTQVKTQDQHCENDAEDRAAAAVLAERLAEERGLHVEIGQFGHAGPPFFAAVMPQVVREGLIAAQYGPDGKTAGSPRQIKWGALLALPGYADGQFSRVEAASQALANYETATATETAPLPLPE
jgi:hypothetical protein